MKNFRNLNIWENGIDLVLKTYRLAVEMPDSEKYGIISQIKRAAISIPSNIAEGNSRTSEKDKRRFIEIALGSANELETLLIIAKHLKMVKQDQIDILLNSLTEEQKQLSSFINKLDKS